MAKKKFEIITELYAGALKEVTAEAENWKAFLRSASRHYRLPFDEQLLVHVQNPDAAAVLEIEDWNRKYGRWVKRGAKGIAVMDKQSAGVRIKYYFDVSDTREGRYKRLLRPVSLWEVRESDREAVRETLENAFGVEEEEPDFAGVITDAVDHAAADNIPDYLDDMMEAREGSPLEEMDVDDVADRLCRIVAESTAYMVMMRCGMEPEKYLPEKMFEGITDFNSAGLVNLLGAATSDIAQMVLLPVADTVKNLRKEEKEQDRTFEGSETEGYNNRKSSTERRDDYENNRIQQAGRLPSAGHHGTGGGTAGSLWEVWITEGELSEREPLRAVPESSDGRETRQPSDGDSKDGAEPGRTDGERNDEDTERDGADEGRRPDEVARYDEQHPSGSGGERHEGTDLHIEESGGEISGKAESWIEPRKETLETFDWSSRDKEIPFLGAERKIIPLLLSVPNLSAGKEDISKFFETHEDDRERTVYIKQIFSSEPTVFTMADGQRAGYKKYENVLRLWKGEPDHITAQSYHEWRLVAEFYDGLRFSGVLRDTVRYPVPVQQQMDVLNEMAGEQAPAFSFTQEIIDYDLKWGSNVSESKYRIFSFYMQGHTAKERVQFLKKEYGIGGRSSIYYGSGIGEEHDGKGIMLYRNEEGADREEIFLKWEQAEKRIGELIAAGQYMTEKELAHLPDYERDILARNIYHFYEGLPEEVIRPFPPGTEYPDVGQAMRPQFRDKERLDVVLGQMKEVLDNTADFAEEYEFMWKTCRDVEKYRNGTYSLFTPNVVEKEERGSHFVPVELSGKEVPFGTEPEKGEADSGHSEDDDSEEKEEGLAGRLNDFYYEFDPYGYRDNMEAGMSQEDVIRQFREHLMDPQNVPVIYENLLEIRDEMEHDDEQYGTLLALIQEIKELPAMNPDYDLKEDTVVFIGTEQYRIGTFSEDMVLLWDMRSPLFSLDMPRDEFERKVRENPGNDHLKIRRPLPEEPPAEKEELPPPAAESGEKEKPEREKSEQDEGNPPDNLAAARRNFELMMELAPEVLYGEEMEKAFWSVDSVMPFSVEYIEEGRIAASHFYENHGDMMADPDMEFVADYENRTLSARTFRQDNMAIDQNVVLPNGDIDLKLEAELNDFAMKWFQNIKSWNNVPDKEQEKEEPETVRDILQNQSGQENPKTPEPESRPENDGETNLTPSWEQPQSKTGSLIPKNQYRITNDELGQGTKKERFRANMMAIQLLKKCEEEGRLATPAEQEVLAGYVGWGGLADAFDETKSSWGMEYLELKTVLTKEEYESARQSTLTAFYTPPVVIRAIYRKLEDMGLKSGNILEPSCGVGNFIGMKPESLSRCQVYGVELDSISGRLAGQLYQQSAISIMGYEQTSLPDSFFDVAVGNVPFGDFKVSDKKYDKHHFLIHDYFFAKTLDQVRPGGVIAFLTSSGTLDKKNPSMRNYIGQRAEFLGAVRLPNNTFQKSAGTEVTSDLIFLQKRDHIREEKMEDWTYLDTNDDGITMNHYFVEHPEMILGEMVMESGPFGMTKTCRPYEDRSLEELLEGALGNIHAEITEREAEEPVEEKDNTIPAVPSVANFSFTIYEGELYYRVNSRMKPVETSVTGANRIRGMIEIRDCARELIARQTEGDSDERIGEKQGELNRLYDVFRSRYGLLNARGNSMVFADDNSYPLLCSLEILKEDGTLERKADIFTKRTIKPHETVRSVSTASEALSLSLSEKAKVDMEYMCSLTGKSREDIEKELTGVIFRLPADREEAPVFVSEDEYLSGNVREKLKEARLAAEMFPVYRSNVEALEKVQPKDLAASEITVRLGTTWIPESDIETFLFELLDTSEYCREHIFVRYAKYTGQWQVEGKSFDKGNIRATSTYGTHRANAYRIIEDTLNLRDVRIYDYVEDDTGKKKAILNKQETAAAQGKQEMIKQAFQDWIWKEPERRQRLTDYYNEHFNAIRPREYDGSHLKFYGINPEIRLRQHQKNGAARIIYGGNTLLAYVVGAGKTYTMVAAAMESKRLGLCSKSMVVVPNHIIEQFAAEWLQLYPAANILVATKKDFEKKNRRKFCARISTSEIDAVIIGHSQFEKIPLSRERQIMELRRQRDEILKGIEEMKRMEGTRFTVKQLEKSKKKLDERLQRLNDQSRKDDVVTFEELGVDRLFVDEADNYKNLYLYTKMTNVGGVAQTEAQKSSDMFMKCRYLDEITGGRGVVFVTGTPVSNSMVELYTMQRYLQYHMLEKHHLQHFDSWVATFGETVSAIELAPEGTGYRLKTRFSRFYNLPELMMMFREVADIQTADMLKLPVPEAEYRVITVKPSDMQKAMVEELGKRAERVRSREVNAKEDNMLLITNDGRKLALDQRLADERLPDEEESKVNACVEEVFRFWEEGKEERLTQLLFCDLSTPKNDGTFSVYNDVRDKLIAKGIPPEEIAFIHDANTDTRKKELFAKVRRGAVRVLMGSTFKMGAGTNVQDRIIASHDLDCPWRPRDLEQRAGRTVRQGNRNKKVDIIRYVTEGTFDAYLYQVIENKQKFISQIMTSKSPARSVEDIDETALSYAEIKALATGNPYIKEKMDLDIQVSRLQMLKQSFLSEKYDLEDKVIKKIPHEIKLQEQRIVLYEKDKETVRSNTPVSREEFPTMEILDKVCHEKKEAGRAIIESRKLLKSTEGLMIGRYRGFDLELSYDAFSKDYILTLHGAAQYPVRLGDDIFGNVTRIDNEIEKIPDRLEKSREKIKSLNVQMEQAKEELKKEFSHEKELVEKKARLAELNVLLDMDKEEKVLLEDDGPEEEWEEPKKKERGWER